MRFHRRYATTRSLLVISRQPLAVEREGPKVWLQQIYDRAGKLYELRSSVVHGGGAPVTDDDLRSIHDLTNYAITAMLTTSPTSA
jgi:hypothetical protein